MTRTQPYAPSWLRGVEPDRPVSDMELRGTGSRTADPRGARIRLSRKASVHADSLLAAMRRRAGHAAALIPTTSYRTCRTRPSRSCAADAVPPDRARLFNGGRR
ncbi:MULTISPECIES: hypothetical protein [Actinoalloteichus]|uniref:hypothetical protein n=1 Tax=Actinoalloteichus TaxID=65496 RepID=UPI0009524F90|nr:MULTISPECIES: hypothetical protein [Actinoalloteichus]